MADYTPVILEAVLSPNPAVAGGSVFVSIAAIDLEAMPSMAVYLSGEFMSGEV